MIKRAVIGLFTVVVIALVVSLSIYFGMKMTSDTYVEAWQTFKTVDGKKVEEKISVTEDSVDIKVPNEMEVIYDYKHSMKVHRFVHHDTGRYGPCYATYINESTVTNPQDARDNIDKKEIDLTEGTSVSKGSVKFTEKKVPSSMLSKDVKEMCHDTEVYWMEYHEEIIERRSSCAYIETYEYCEFYNYSGYYQCICYTFYFCCDSAGNCSYISIYELIYYFDYY